MTALLAHFRAVGEERLAGAWIVLGMRGWHEGDSDEVPEMVAALTRLDETLPESWDAQALADEWECLAQSEWERAWPRTACRCGQVVMICPDTPIPDRLPPKRDRERRAAACVIAIPAEDGTVDRWVRECPACGELLWEALVRGFVGSAAPAGEQMELFA